MKTPASAPNARAIILAAGLGSRLKPLTDKTPKPLLEVGGHPLIVYSLNLLRAHGIDEVVINVHHLGDRIEEALGDGSRYGLNILYSHEETLLDSGGGIRQAATRFEGALESPIVVMNADVVSAVPLGKLLAFHQERRALLSLTLRDDPRKHAYGVFGIDNEGRIQQFLGRGPSNALPEYMFGSVQVLSPELIERMPDGAFPSMRSFYPTLFDQGARFFGYVYDGPWFTADTPEDLESTDAALRAGGVPAHMLEAT